MLLVVGIERGGLFIDMSVVLEVKWDLNGGVSDIHYYASTQKQEDRQGREGSTHFSQAIAEGRAR